MLAKVEFSLKSFILNFIEFCRCLCVLFETKAAAKRRIFPPEGISVRLVCVHKIRLLHGGPEGAGGVAMGWRTLMAGGSLVKRSKRVFPFNSIRVLRWLKTFLYYFSMSYGKNVFFLFFRIINNTHTRKPMHTYAICCQPYTHTCA